MLNSKQRAYLKGLASTLPALYQIGKEGVSDNTIIMLDQGLEANELIKIHVLENSMLDIKETCKEIAEKTKSEPVLVIGKKIVLYRPKKKDPVIVLPKK